MIEIEFRAVEEIFPDSNVTFEGNTVRKTKEGEEVHFKNLGRYLSKGDIITIEFLKLSIPPAMKDRHDQ